jgi:plasmid stability protein
MAHRRPAATIPDVAILYVRNLAPEVIARIRRRAAARGLKVEDYIERLLQLHEDMLALASLPLPPNEGLAAVDRRLIQQTATTLDAHGLGRVLD